jgi:hypothetical protein
MSTATSGRAREYKVRDLLVAAGWRHIMRAAASKGSGDLLMGHETHGAALIQVGTRNKQLGPSDRNRFVDDAELIGALPLLAVVVPRNGVTFWRVTRDPGSYWLAFHPERGLA